MAIPAENEKLVLTQAAIAQRMHPRQLAFFPEQRQACLRSHDPRPGGGDDPRRLLGVRPGTEQLAEPVALQIDSRDSRVPVALRETMLAECEGAQEHAGFVQVSFLAGKRW